LLRWIGWYFSLPLIKALWIGIIVAIALWLGLGFYRGIRYPILQLEPRASVTQWHREDSVWEIKADGMFFDKFHRSRIARARAYVPEPSVTITNHDSESTLLLTVYNLHPDARVIFSAEGATVEERIYGINRQLVIKTKPSIELQLRWTLPKKDRYRLAAIGDSGAGTELAWILKRSHDLGADFLMHVGDIFYTYDDVRTARAVLDRSPIPVYLVVGNHDFRGHSRFGFKLPLTYIRQIGPRNYSFTLNDKRIIAMDTAEGTFPAGRGERGALIRRILSEAQNDQTGEGSNTVTENLFFAHRPVSDESVEHDDVRNRSVRDGEASWLMDKILKLSNPTLIFGHVHESLEYTIAGVKAYVTGEGWALVNLLNAKLEAQILMIELEENQPAEFWREDLAMPRSYHCSKIVIDALAFEHTDLAVDLEKNCLRGLTGYTPDSDPTH